MCTSAHMDTHMYMRCGIGGMSFKLDRIDAGVDATTHRGHGGKGGGGDRFWQQCYQRHSYTVHNV